MARAFLTQQAFKPCHAIGCADFVDRAVLFCDKHDRMLQSDIRSLVHKHYRPGKKQSKLFDIHLETARQEILFCQSAGYRMPREAEFEW